MASARRVLIVEDDPTVLAAITRAVGRTHDAVPCSSAAAAFDALAAPPLGVIVDLNLGGELDGVHVVGELRRLSGCVPALIMTGAASLTTDTIERLNQLGSAVWFARKPFAFEEISTYLELAGIMASLDLVDGKQLATTVRDVARRHGLTAAERTLLAHVARGGKRGEIAARVGINEHTLKTRIRKLLRKTGHRDVRDLRREMLQDAELIQNG